MCESNKTGYPSIDKPWMKYYSEEAINAPLPECTLFDYLRNNNLGYESRTAFDYFGNKISYGTLLENILQAAKAFAAAGVQSGDIVTISSVSTPETFYAFYGLNYLGAVSNMVDPRTSAEGIREYLLEAKSQIVLCIDAALQKMAEAVRGTEVKFLVALSPADSLPQPKKLFYRLLNPPKHPNAIHCRNWTEFIRTGKNCIAEKAPYRKDTCCVIVHTGGTTGSPKGVMLTNDNLNCGAHQCRYSNFDLQRHHKWLNIMPPFIAYGIGNGLHLPLTCGQEVILIPKFDPQKYDQLLLKYHPQHMVGVPSHYEGIVFSKKIGPSDLSDLISPVVGGDSMKADLEDSVNCYLHNHGCRHRVIKGYGLTEVNAAVAASASEQTNVLGSVGIPLPHSTISIFDPDTGAELPYGSQGEICITGPNTMLGYLNNEAATAEILRAHEDGQVWVHSGDLGHMDENGFLFIDGRIKRMIIRHDGFKVFPPAIEQVIESHHAVKACCVVGVQDPDHAHGKLPAAYVTLKRNITESTQKILEELQTLCEKSLAEYAKPVRFEYVSEFPLTPIGKVDFRALEELAKEKQRA